MSSQNEDEVKIRRASLDASALSAARMLATLPSWAQAGVGMTECVVSTLKRHGLVRIRLLFGSNLTDAVTQEWADGLVGLGLAEYVE